MGEAQKDQEKEESALGLDFTWLKDWSLQMLQTLEPTHLEGREREAEAVCDVSSGSSSFRSAIAWAVPHLG